MMIIRSFDVNCTGKITSEGLKGGIVGGSIVQGLLRVGQEIEIRPGYVEHRQGGEVICKPLFSRIRSL